MKSTSSESRTRTDLAALCAQSPSVPAPCSPRAGPSLLLHSPVQLCLLLQAAGVSEGVSQPQRRAGRLGAFPAGPASGGRAPPCRGPGPRPHPPLWLTSSAAALNQPGAHSQPRLGSPPLPPPPPGNSRRAFSSQRQRHGHGQLGTVPAAGRTWPGRRVGERSGDSVGPAAVLQGSSPPPLGGHRPMSSTKPLQQPGVEARGGRDPAPRPLARGPGRRADVAWGFLGPRYPLGCQADPQAGDSQCRHYTVSPTSCPELGGV